MSADIQKQISELSGSLVHTSMQRDGTIKFYTAACFAGNAQEAVRLREQMHTLLDAELDLLASVMHLSKQASLE